MTMHIRTFAIAAFAALVVSAGDLAASGQTTNTVVETFFTPRTAFERMVPDAPRLSFAKFTPTPQEAAAVKRRRGIDIDPTVERTFFFGWSDRDSLVGAMYVGESMGKHGPIVMAIGLTPAGVVRDLAVMRYQEVYGRPVRERDFLGQYVGKGVEDPIRVGRDIRNLTGATISSHAVTTIVKEAVALFELFVIEKKGAVPPSAGAKSGGMPGG